MSMEEKRKAIMEYVVIAMLNLARVSSFTYLASHSHSIYFLRQNLP